MSCAAAVARFRDQFSAALHRWGRMLSAGLLVYGSYFFWFFVPFTAMIALLGRRTFRS